MTTARGRGTVPVLQSIPRPTWGRLGATPLEASEGRARARFAPGADATDADGFVQDGVLVACLDCVMGLALSSLGRAGFFETASMAVSFRGRADASAELVGEATVVRAGRRHLLVEARLVRAGAGGGELARASAMSSYEHGDAP